MFGLSRAISGLLATAPVGRTALAPTTLQKCTYASYKPKTNALKSKEKSKLRRQRINKTDRPVQAKRSPRVSKL
ncbi:hypothetical protein LPJ53_000417 [Coemansia erecta]|uniref:Uncharacterized protein n=1 Tax=Coemansia erecta TaxID=147472 RepID=A0A9W8CTU5_9FUNG|nr:hypothetical protein LPJ53_000417 [Coemansia erecta]